MVQCKIQFDAKDIPIAIGDVTIKPGNIIVADGDGVIVVPRKHDHSSKKSLHPDIYI